ncbi:MAG: endonuclease MutS2 [Lachnospirales bacterium]
MINEKSLRVLEFYKIREMLVKCAISSMGKAQSESVVPITDIDLIKEKQRETSDAVNCITKKGSLPLGGISDISEGIKRVRAFGNLNMEELRNMADFIYVCNKAMKYSQKVGSEPDYPLIDNIFNEIVVIPKVMTEINRCIVSSTEMADTATDELFKIRQSLRGTSDKVKEKLNQIIQSQTYRTMLQDTVITLRNDRFCIPVKAEHKNSINGLVHDQSATGQTVFIEPMACVELNNKARELMIKEQKEMEKVLAYLSNMVYENSDLFMINYDLLTKLDVIFARGELSIKLECIQPQINNNGYTNIVKGRHPLIDKNEVVPINIYLGDKFSTLLITGPNTGGKTVSIKTLGLLTLMTQSGLHIPCASGTEINVYDNVYSDIGDEQSIEQSLSTFSSHMTNIVSVLKEVKSNNLVLFDELGAGTDPVEGACLAMSILQYLYDVGASVCVTTHYPELKAYALSTKGVENASCEFDVVSLKPTYRLLIGVPGKSNAFAISKRLGLDESIIEDAKNFMNKEDQKFEDVITDLELSKIQAEREREEAKKVRKELQNLKDEIAREQDKFQERKDKIIKDAKIEARKITVDAKMLADEILKEMKKVQSSASVKEVDQTRQMLQDEISGYEKDIYSDKGKIPKVGNSNHNFKIGDKVYINSLRDEGVVVSNPDKSNIVGVACGIMNIKVKTSDLQYLNQVDKKPRPPKPQGKQRVSKARNLKAEINILGMTVQEGRMEVSKYIDDAVISNFEIIRIVHGKGTGALRKGIHDYLRTHKNVKSYRLGEFGEGDHGVTIVTIK